MKTKTKKMIAPVVIVALISIYYIAIGVIFAYMNGVPMLAKIIALVVPALLSGVAITVLIQRIKEIKKGERISCRALKILLAENLLPIMR